MTKAFVLHSGGLDSTVALALAIRDHKQVVSVGIDYNQRHVKELDQAEKIVGWYNRMGYNVKRVDLDINNMPESMLTDPDQEVPDASYADLPEGVSPTYVPFRNGQMLSMIAALASVEEGKSVIYAGMHAEDAERDAYPDCTSHFLGAMAAAIYIGTYHKVRLNTPLVSMYKWEIVKLGHELSAPLPWTWSCYKGGVYHCGKCPTCRARKEAFAKANIPDSTEYVEDMPDDDIPF